MGITHVVRGEEWISSTPKHVQLYRWLGWDEDKLPVFQREQSQCKLQCKALVLATGGGSWARLGSDGAWFPWLQERGVDMAPLRPSNCGFDVGWHDGRAPGWRPRRSARRGR